MNPSKLFALQTTRVPNNEGVGGGVPEFTPDLAAHYCQGMPNHWYLAARVRWAIDIHAMESLERKLWDEVVIQFPAKKWRMEKKYHGQQMRRKLAQLALAEMLEPVRMREKQLKAAFIGVSPSAWSKTWQGRYEDVYKILNEWTNEAYRYLQKQQARDEI